MDSEQSPPPDPSPADVERQQAPLLVEQARRYDERVKGFINQGKTRRLSSAELKEFTSELDQWEAYFKQHFEQTAHWLDRNGLPLMRKWLDWALGDMPGLRQTFSDWSRQAARHETDMQQTLADANREIQEKLNEAREGERRATQDWIDRWKA